MSQAPKRVALLFPGYHGGRVVRWAKAAGSTVDKGALVAECECFVAPGERDFPELKAVHAPDSGVLSSSRRTEGEEVLSRADGDAESQTLGHVELCPHPTIYEGMCCVCAKEVRPSTQHRTINKSGGLRLQYSEHEAQDTSKKTTADLFESRQLSLILDLDHTVLHTTNDPRAQSLMLPNHDEFVRFELKGERPMYTRLRPGGARGRVSRSRDPAFVQVCDSG